MTLHGHSLYEKSHQCVTPHADSLRWPVHRSDWCLTQLPLNQLPISREAWRGINRLRLRNEEAILIKKVAFITLSWAHITPLRRHKFATQMGHGLSLSRFGVIGELKEREETSGHAFALEVHFICRKRRLFFYFIKSFRPNYKQSSPKKSCKTNSWQHGCKATINDKNKIQYQP